MNWPTSTSACRIEPSSTCNPFDAVILEMINQSRVTCLSGQKPYEQRLNEKVLRRFIVKSVQVDVCAVFPQRLTSAKKTTPCSQNQPTNETKCIVHHLQENTNWIRWNMLNSSLRSKEKQINKQQWKHKPRQYHYIPLPPWSCDKVCNKVSWRANSAALIAWRLRWSDRWGVVDPTMENMLPFSLPTSGSSRY